MLPPLTRIDWRLNRLMAEVLTFWQPPNTVNWMYTKKSLQQSRNNWFPFEAICWIFSHTAAHKSLNTAARGATRRSFNEYFIRWHQARSAFDIFGEDYSIKLTQTFFSADDFASLLTCAWPHHEVPSPSRRIRGHRQRCLRTVAGSRWVYDSNCPRSH